MSNIFCFDNMDRYLLIEGNWSCMKLETCKCGGVKRKGYEKCRKCFLEFYKNRLTKICKGCNLELPLENFRKRLNENRPRSRCKECEAQYSQKRRLNNPEESQRRKKEWQRNNPERQRRIIRRRGWKVLGLDPDLIEPLFESHNKKCDCCGIETENLVTDHCHKQGNFRGFLCSNCNTGLGQFKDDPIRLQKAIDYLNRTCVSHTLAQNPVQPIPE